MKVFKELPMKNVSLFLGVTLILSGCTTQKEVTAYLGKKKNQTYFSTKCAESFPPAYKNGNIDSAEYVQWVSDYLGRLKFETANFPTTQIDTTLTKIEDELSECDKKYNKVLGERNSLLSDVNNAIKENSSLKEQINKALIHNVPPPIKIRDTVENKAALEACESQKKDEVNALTEKVNKKDFWMGIWIGVACALLIIVLILLWLLQRTIKKAVRPVPL